MENPKWRNDKIQFARLLAEINGIGLSDMQFRELEESMGLSRNEIQSIFERAEKEFTKIKFNS